MAQTSEEYAASLDIIHEAGCFSRDATPLTAVPATGEYAASLELIREAGPGKRLARHVCVFQHVLIPGWCRCGRGWSRGWGWGRRRGQWRRRQQWRLRGRCQCRWPWPLPRAGALVT